MHRSLCSWHETASCPDLPCAGPGLSRSGTESLQHALLKLGYEQTYHGFDLLFELPSRIPAFCALIRRKYSGEGGAIKAEDLDAIFGHADALVEIPASVFLAELVDAYPDAKVILNTRGDVDKWHKSIVDNLAVIHDSWFIYALCWCTSDGFWTWQFFWAYLWPSQFRSLSRSKAHLAIRGNGKWVYREHCSMVRGLVPQDRLLEWRIEDGWGPICKVHMAFLLACYLLISQQFLDKPVPDEPFPRTNDAFGFAKQLDRWTARNFAALRTNAAIAVLLFGVASGAWRYL